MQSTMLNSDVEKGADQVVAECLDRRWFDLAEEGGWDEGLGICSRGVWSDPKGEFLGSFVVLDKRSGLTE